MESMTQGEVESNAIAVTRVADQAGPGTLAMALMSEAEFGTRLAALKRGQARISQIKRELMQDGSHYGTIPGTKKPTLLKPGAEVLKSLGFASSKDVPEDKARAVFEALEAAAPKREPGSDDDDPFGKLHEDAIPENVGPQR